MDFNIRKFQEKWPDFHAFSRSEIRAFFRVCSDRRLPGGKEALSLLLNPDEADLPSYYLRLSGFLAQSRIRIAEIAPEFLRVFFELAASFPEILGNPELRSLLERAFAKLPRKLLPWLFEKRFPVGPFLNSIGKITGLRRAGSARAMPPASEFFGRNRLRLLVRLLSGTRPWQVSDPCTEITMADLRPLLAQLSGRNRPHTAVAAWRRTAKHLIDTPTRFPQSNPAKVSQAGPAASPPFSKINWAGAGSRTLSYWDRLAEAQAKELAEASRLTSRVSTRTGRIVLSWHNASLGAAGGWGFEDIEARFPSPAAYREFARSALQAAREIRTDFGDEITALLAIRNRRIFGPKAVQALNHIRASSRLCSERRAGWRETSRKAAVLLDSDEIESIEAGNKSEWPGALAPHQIVCLDRVLSWVECARKTWVDGFCLFLALAVRGQMALDSGTVSSLVLPWIDKFFISSLRRADQGYLERLFRLVESALGKPLIIFWEDTAHARLPSFRLAIDELSGRGLPFRGIGIFDRNGSMRAHAAEIVRKEFPENRLFALRPVDDNHFPDTFRRIFDLLDPDFLRNYDSSWKDNLVFIYTGTQVFPLLSVQTEMESIGAWVSDGHGRYPFGAWFRRKLRKLALARPHETRDPLWLAYSSWANLL